MLRVQTHYAWLWSQCLRVDFIWWVSLTSVCEVYGWAPIKSCFLLLVIILLPCGYFWDFFFFFFLSFCLMLKKYTRQQAMRWHSFHACVTLHYLTGRCTARQTPSILPSNILSKTWHITSLGEDGGGGLVGWEWRLGDGLHWHHVQDSTGLEGHRHADSDPMLLLFFTLMCCQIGCMGSLDLKMVCYDWMVRG